MQLNAKTHRRKIRGPTHVIRLQKFVVATIGIAEPVFHCDIVWISIFVQGP